MRDRFDVNHLVFEHLATFAAQGAVGGGAGCFLLTVFKIFYLPNPYNILLIYIFLFYFLPSLMAGMITATLVWLSVNILNRKPGFFAGFVVGMAATTITATPFSLESETVVNWRFFWVSSLICGGCAGLLTGLIVRSGMNPGRSIVLGPAGLNKYRSFWRWVLSATSFPLRVLGLLGGLLSMVLIASLSSNVLAGSNLSPDDTNMFVGIVVMLLYFSMSVVVTITLPRKTLLLGLAGLSNAPLAVWALSHGAQEFVFLIVLTWIFIFLWIVLIGARMIAPEITKRDGGFLSVNGSEL